MRTDPCKRKASTEHRSSMRMTSMKFSVLTAQYMLVEVKEVWLGRSERTLDVFSLLGENR